MKKTILIMIVLAAVAGGCKKYEEGPLVSTLSVKKRIYGYHELTEYKVDEADSISQYYDNLGLSFYFFYNEDTEVDVCIIGGSDIYWGWELSEDKKLLNIYWAGGLSNGVGPFGRNKNPIWEIIKLGKEQIKLKTDYNGKEYEIELER